MLTPSLASLPTALDQPDGHPMGMFAAMGLIALIAAAILVAAVLVGRARDRRRPKQPPVYPILEPPNGRDTVHVGPRHTDPRRPGPRA